MLNHYRKFQIACHLDKPPFAKERFSKTHIHHFVSSFFNKSVSIFEFSLTVPAIKPPISTAGLLKRLETPYLNT